jgi:hypothetical protein
MAGNRRNAVNWLVDGASNVDVGSNITLLATPTLESIEEFKIITTGYNAEWPRSGGGIVNVVTKGGSNLFRGSGYEFFRNDSLNANSWTSATRAPTPRRRTTRRSSVHNFGYTLGGPGGAGQGCSSSGRRSGADLARAGVADSNTIDPAWLNDPANPNYVAPADRDPNAVATARRGRRRISGRTASRDAPNDQDTRQEVIARGLADEQPLAPDGRYTHDLSMTTEPGGLFFGTAVPGRRHDADRRARPRVRRRS